MKSNQIKGKWKFGIILLVFVILFGIGGYFIGSLSAKRAAGEDTPPEIESDVIIRQIMDEPDYIVEDLEKHYTVSVWDIEEVLRPASDLITTRYFYTDADVFENYKNIKGWKIPLTTNQVVFTYSGTISLGLDFSKISIDVDNDALEIIIKLPEIKILANEIDASSFEYYDVSSSIFNKLEMEEVTGMLDGLKEKKASNVMANEEILMQAETNAKNILRDFLSVSDLTNDFKVVFK